MIVRAARILKLASAGNGREAEIIKIFVPFPKNMCTMVHHCSLYQWHTELGPLHRPVLGLVSQSRALEKQITTVHRFQQGAIRARSLRVNGLNVGFWRFEKVLITES